MTETKKKTGLVLPGPIDAHPERIRIMNDGEESRVIDTFPIPGDDEVIVATIGGIGDIGMNLTLYGHAGKWLGVDAGVGFVRNSYENKSVSRRYRVQAEFIDPATFSDILDRLVGFIFTHGHEDHIGAVPYMFDPEYRPSTLYDENGCPVDSVTINCPIYATPVCAKMIVNKLSPQAEQSLDIHYFNSGDVLDIGPFKVATIAVTHSIIEAVSLAIITNQGAIVHTGDWKIEENPLLGAEIDTKRFKELGDSGYVIGVLSDSTNAGRYQENPTTEQDVISGIKHVFDNHKKGKVVVCCFASNVPRLHGISNAARQSGRKVGVVGSAMVSMQEIIVSEGISSAIPFTETDMSRLEGVQENEKAIICTGTQGEEMAALAKMARGDRNLPKLSADDIVIMSASVIPGNEASVNAVVERLRRNGIKVIMGDDKIDGYPVHVTGHATAGETRWLYDILKPKTVIPVHGTNNGLVENALIASETTNAIIPKAGSVFSFKNGGNKIDILGIKKYIIGEYRAP